MNFLRSRKTSEVDREFDAPTTALDDIAGNYTIDPMHSRIGFSARHAMVTTVRGEFSDFEGTAHIDTASDSSHVELTIQAASIVTGVEGRDGHLRGSDFLDGETHPTITFVSTRVERDGLLWAITGDLTIRGVAKPITIDVESTGSARDHYGLMRAGFEGAAVLYRKDWGLGWNVVLDTGGVLVSDKVKLEFDISAIQNS